MTHKTQLSMSLLVLKLGSVSLWRRMRQHVGFSMNNIVEACLMLSKVSSLLRRMVLMTMRNRKKSLVNVSTLMNVISVTLKKKMKGMNSSHQRTILCSLTKSSLMMLLVDSRIVCMPTLSEVVSCHKSLSSLMTSMMIRNALKNNSDCSEQAF